MKPKGRPNIYGKPQERSTVTLPQETVEKGRKIGEGNLSLGIRMAVKEYKLKK